ncbi:MAG: HAMP domain-containing protein, partial [Candidatus Nanohaloarchaea archaeon]|nr:HAMP domain-containing protein [Candidatus Nanohaloarchaea archaeon]
MRIRTKQVLGVLLVALLASGLFLTLLGIVERGEQDLVAEFEQSGHADPHVKAMESVFDRMEYLTLLSAIAVLLGASFLGLYFVHLVVDPLEQLRDTLEGISKGLMDEEIPQPVLEREDEIGEVANAFDRLIVSMRLAMGQEEPEAIERNEELQQEVVDKAADHGVSAYILPVLAENHITRDAKAGKRLPGVPADLDADTGAESIDSFSW